MSADDLMLTEFDPRHSADGETPAEAAMRAVAPLLQKIRYTALLPAGMLPIGCAVRVANEWYSFAGLDSQGRMLLGDGNSRDPWLYGPGEGETFAWSSPF